MKYLIINKEETKLISPRLFNSLKEASSYKTNRITYWNIFCEKNGNVPILNVWKNSIIVKSKWQEVYSDIDIVSLHEQNRRKPILRIKELAKDDMREVSNKIDKQLNKQYRRCYAG